MLRGSVEKLTSGCQVDILELHDVVGPGLGHTKEWQKINTEPVDCLVVPQSGIELIALMQAQVRAFYTVYFSSEQHLNPMIHRLRYNGTILRLQGPVLPPYGRVSLYRVQAAYYSEDQPSRT